MRRLLISSPLVALLLALVVASPAAAKTRIVSVRATVAGRSTSGAKVTTRFNLHSGGRLTGHGAASCNKNTLRCSLNFSLGRSSLRGSLTLTRTGAFANGRVTGGSGSYRHARGWFRVHAFAAVGYAQFTFHLS